METRESDPAYLAMADRIKMVCTQLAMSMGRHKPRVVVGLAVAMAQQLQIVMRFCRGRALWKQGNLTLCRYHIRYHGTLGDGHTLYNPYCRKLRTKYYWYG